MYKIPNNTLILKRLTINHYISNPLLPQKKHSRTAHFLFTSQTPINK